MTFTILLFFFAPFLAISLGHPGPQPYTTSSVQNLFPSVVMTPFSVLPIIAYTLVFLALLYVVVRVVRRLRGRVGAISPTPISTKKPSKWTWNGLRRTWKGRTHLQGVELLPTNSSKADLEYNMRFSNVQLNQTQVLSRSPSMEALQDFVPLPPTPLHHPAFPLSLPSSPDPVRYQPSTNPFISAFPLSPPPPFHITANALQALPFKLPSLFPPTYPRTPSPNINITLATSPLKPHRRSRSLGGVPLRRLSPQSPAASPDDLVPLERVPSQVPLIDFSEPPRVVYNHDEPHPIAAPTPLSRANSARGSDLGTGYAHEGVLVVPAPLIDYTHGSMPPEDPFLDGVSFTSDPFKSENQLSANPFTTANPFTSANQFPNENPFKSANPFPNENPFTGGVPYSAGMHTPHLWAFDADINEDGDGDDTLVMDPSTEKHAGNDAEKDLVDLQVGLKDGIYAQVAVTYPEANSAHDEKRVPPTHVPLAGDDMELTGHDMELTGHDMELTGHDMELARDDMELTRDDMELTRDDMELTGHDTDQETKHVSSVDTHSHTWNWDADEWTSSAAQDEWTSSTAQDEAEDEWTPPTTQDDSGYSLAIDDPGYSPAIDDPTVDEQDLIHFEHNDVVVLDVASLVDSPAHHDGPLKPSDEPLVSPKLEDVEYVPATIDPSLLTATRFPLDSLALGSIHPSADFVPNILVHPPSPMVSFSTDLEEDGEPQSLSESDVLQPLSDVLQPLSEGDDLKSLSENDDLKSLSENNDLKSLSENDDLKSLSENDDLKSLSEVTDTNHPTETSPPSTIEPTNEAFDHPLDIVVGPTEIEGPVEELVLSHKLYQVQDQQHVDEQQNVDENQQDATPSQDDDTTPTLSPRPRAVPPLSIALIHILAEQVQSGPFPDPELLPLPGLEGLTTRLQNISTRDVDVDGNGNRDVEGDRDVDVDVEGLNTRPPPKFPETELPSQTPTPPASPPSASSPLRSPRVVAFPHGREEGREKEKDVKEGKDTKDEKNEKNIKEEKERPAWSLRASDAPPLGLSSAAASPTSPHLAIPPSPRAPKLDIKLDSLAGGVGAPAMSLSTSLPGAFVESEPPTIVITAPTSALAPSPSPDTTTSTPTSTPTKPPPPPPANSNTLTAMAMITHLTSHHQQRTRTPRSPLDIALAMQLRPGLGVGADPAWMVRFLMSMFGWLALLVAGQGEF